MLTDDSVICGIDLGSGRLKSAAAVLDKKGNVLKLECADTQSQGLSAGLITDISKLSIALKELIAVTEKKIGRRIKRVYVGINNRDINFRNSEAVIPLSERGNKIVTLSDINLLNSQARSLGLKLDEEIIHDFAYGYILDDYNHVENPKGLSGHKLSVKMCLVINKIVHIENIIRLLNQAGLEAEAIVFSGIASSLAVLSENEKRKGCALLDIGSDLTQLLIFKDGLLRELNLFIYGGNNITGGLCEVLKLPRGLAEEIKASYGAATSGDIGENEEVMIKKEEAYNSIKRRVIAGVIEPQITELLTRVREKIGASPCLKATDYSAVIIGASALLDGFLELTESVLGVKARLGIPKIRNSSKTQISPAHSSRFIIYATAIGAICYGIDAAKRNRLAIFKSRNNNLLTHVAGRIKDIYSEYF